MLPYIFLLCVGEYHQPRYIWIFSVALAMISPERENNGQYGKTW